MKTVLQIESIEAGDILTRLDNIEAAIAMFIGSQPKETPQTSTEYLTPKEVAKLFKISLVTVHDWTKKGILQGYKIGNRVYYNRLDIEQALVKKYNLQSKTNE